MKKPEKDWIVTIEVPIMVRASVTVSAVTENDARDLVEATLHHKFGEGFDGTLEASIIEAAGENLAAVAGSIDSLLEEVIDQAKIIEVEEDEEPETDCRDCGVPCRHEKDADGFHREG